MRSQCRCSDEPPPIGEVATAHVAAELTHSRPTKAGRPHERSPSRMPFSYEA